MKSFLMICMSVAVIFIGWFVIDRIQAARFEEEIRAEKARAIAGVPGFLSEADYTSYAGWMVVARNYLTDAEYVHVCESLPPTNGKIDCNLAAHEIALRVYSSVRTQAGGATISPTTGAVATCLAKDTRVYCLGSLDEATSALRKAMNDTVKATPAELREQAAFLELKKVALAQALKRLEYALKNATPIRISPVVPSSS